MNENKKNQEIRFAFFGSSRFSVRVLEELEKLGLIPVCVITTPDKPKGRKLELTQTEVKEWARKRYIEVLDPEKLDHEFLLKIGKNENCDLFIVASYGKIIPASIINLPVHKTLNIHPSVLPKYRGPSPLQSAMLDDCKNTGVSIMRLDEQVDHGPVVAQEAVHLSDSFTEWPIYEDFEELMAKKGAQLLGRTMPDWVQGKIHEQEQDHSKATFTKKIKKEDGLIDLGADPYVNYLKIQTYHQWPQAYFFTEKAGKKIRVKITAASFRDGKLIIEKIIPEGGKEIIYTL